MIRKVTQSNLVLADDLAVVGLPDDSPQNSLDFGDGRRVLVRHVGRGGQQLGEVDVVEERTGQETLLLYFSLYIVKGSYVRPTVNISLIST